MSSFDDDDDLTDIRQLPDLDDEQEESFESLEDIAQNLGFETSEEDDDENDGSDEDSMDFGDDTETSFNELPDSPPDFEFSENEDFSAQEETSDFDFPNEEIENEVEAHEDSFDFGKVDEPEEDVTSFDADEVEEEKQEDDYQPRSDFALEEELKTPPEEPALKKTPVSQIKEEKRPHSTAPEEFEEISNFAKDMRSENYSSEGNPPFSIILKNIKYYEDAKDIAQLLVQFKIIEEDKTEETVSSLTKGTYLIPRLSEFAAIIICHKLRSFDLEILMGLTEEIAPPKSYESNDRGSTSKRTLLSNKKHNISKKTNLPFEEILTTTLPNFNDHTIGKYIGIASESKIVGIELLHRSDSLETEILEQISEKEQDEVKLLRLKKENQSAADSKFGFDFEKVYGESGTQKPQIGLEHIYTDLITNLKTQAKNAGANAIVGINFSISPISIEEYLSQGPRYQILCTGNMVWIEKT